MLLLELELELELPPNEPLLPELEDELLDTELFLLELEFELELELPERNEPELLPEFERLTLLPVEEPDLDEELELR